MLALRIWVITIIIITIPIETKTIASNVDDDCCCCGNKRALWSLSFPQHHHRRRHVVHWIYVDVKWIYGLPQGNWSKLLMAHIRWLMNLVTRGEIACNLQPRTWIFIIALSIKTILGHEMFPVIKYIYSSLYLFKCWLLIVVGNTDLLLLCSPGVWMLEYRLPVNKIWLTSLRHCMLAVSAVLLPIDPSMRKNVIPRVLALCSHSFTGSVIYCWAFLANCKQRDKITDTSTGGYCCYLIWMQLMTLPSIIIVVVVV